MIRCAQCPACFLRLAERLTQLTVARRESFPVPSESPPAAKNNAESGPTDLTLVACSLSSLGVACRLVEHFSPFQLIKDVVAEAAIPAF
jgi:hypothetical protein